MPREALRNGLGGRIAAIRGTRRMKQDDLAQAANVSLSMLRKIEQGTRVPSDHVLDAIAAALGVDPSRLLGNSGRLDSRVHDAIPALREVIAAYDVPDEGPVRPVPALRASVASVVQKRLSAQYIRLAQTLPGLLGELIRGVHSTANPDDIAALLVATYRAADAVAYKYGYLDLSARLIELMRQTSATTEDPLLSASTAYVRTEVFFAAHAYHAGLRAIEAAIDRLPEKAGRSRLGVLGSLHMRAAVIAARAANADAAMSHLSEARRLGDLVPEDIYYGTAFGPCSVRVHEVSVALGLGDCHLQLALALGESWSPPLEMPAERRSGFFIDLARAQLWAGLKDAAFESLKTARRIAPQHTREHPWVREDAETLLRLYRANSESLISFAEWAGVV
ncbi:transcriptional regulator with XRE-family HTH domain [Streptosporangium becharense]|uniref:Transcriptional regulator with XRE-family HTH domain n=1 Tax=Streptosporangium becharense TaxID=1816182 RepID=A0A7W9IGJ0_9ACTN|nr:helix-turn-helix transcriptional regulator [Streptosporangium becharense]MBB2914835.1 transcriptional regulator with XRE-family HTH domain [Streptosporangium becharense]MBB5820354.1 transcriptional regulator with XRE-family HTH domain [Streptosporangium becharense]